MNGGYVKLTLVPVFASAQPIDCRPIPAAERLFFRAAAAFDLKLGGQCFFACGALL